MELDKALEFSQGFIDRNKGLFKKVVEVPVKIDASYGHAKASSAGEFLPEYYKVRVTGKMVGATVNSNNDGFKEEGLKAALAHIKDLPMNFLHWSDTVVGCITEARWVEATDTFPGHIEVDSVIWPHVASGLFDYIEESNASGKLFLSMECVANTVECASCEEQYPFLDVAHGKSCSHIKAGEARYYLDPVFLGCALIVDPTQPGWADADANIPE